MVKDEYETWYNKRMLELESEKNERMVSLDKSFKFWAKERENKLI